MKKCMPFLTNVISPVIGVAFEMQASHGNVKIEETSVSEVGVWESTFVSLLPSVQKYRR